MSEEDILCLEWSDFRKNLAISLQELHSEKKFSDVTLVSEDKTQFQAHKTVLAACSPILKNMLLDSQDSHTWLYLTGVYHEEVQALLDLMYMGDTKMEQRMTKEFMELVTALGLKELTEECAESEAVFFSPSPIVKLECEPSHTEEIMFKEEPVDDDNWNISNSNEDDNQSCADLSKPEYKCDVCDKVFNKRPSMMLHKKVKHEGVRYACDQCDYQATQMTSLKTHKKSKHEGVKHKCDQCDYTAKQQSDIRKHRQFVHEGVRHYCDQCNYEGTTQGNLKKHKQAVHEGIRYTCDQCDYQATQRGHLKKHIQFRHEGVVHSCDKCNYKTGWSQDLLKHKKTMHT